MGTMLSTGIEDFWSGRQMTSESGFVKLVMQSFYKARSEYCAPKVFNEYSRDWYET